jgi:2-octaprenyl-6-methoxyphenol hydroxylase
MQVGSGAKFGLMKPFDVLIIGAGLNGLATALAMAGSGNRTPLRVALVDARDPSQANAVTDSRASAITEAARRMFDVMGLWKDLAPFAQPMREIIVTDGRVGGPRPTLLHFDEETQVGGPAAWLFENHRLLAGLLDAVKSSSTIEIKTGATVERYAFHGPTATAYLDSGVSLEARLIVAADGRNSSARKASGIETIGWAYGQSGIVTTVAHEDAHDGRAEEHFLPSGPFAILPLQGNRSSLVWTEPTVQADRIMALTDGEFLEELRSRFGEHLGQVTLAGPRQSWPLSLFLAQRMVGERLALVGDAAHVVHPIAGLGFNLGLRDAAALAEAVTAQVRLGLDPGGPSALANYERWRRSDTMAVAVACDGLNRLFSNDVQALRLVRDFGLSIVEKTSPLKRFFMREAAGMSGNMPRLLMGEPI